MKCEEKMRRIFLIFIMAVCLCSYVSAQSRRMPIYDTPSSSFSMGVGGCRMGLQNTAYIYTNPVSAYLGEDSVWTADYAYADMGQDLSLHTITGAYRSGDHVLMAGVRYFSEGSIDRQIDVDMNIVGGRVNFYSYSTDLGYSHRFGKFSVYGMLDVASEKTTVRSSAYSVSLGAGYTDSLLAGVYTVAASIRNMGVVSYQNKNKRLSPLVSAGGSFTFPSWQKQTISIYADGGVYLSDGTSGASAVFSGGIDYTLMKRYSLRAGGHLEGHDNYLTAGVGCRVACVTIEAAAKLAKEETAHDIYMIGVKWQLP